MFHIIKIKSLFALLLYKRVGIACYFFDILSCKTDFCPFKKKVANPSSNKRV